MKIVSITTDFKRWLKGDLTRQTLFSDKKSRLFERMNCIPYDTRCSKEMNVVRILWFIVRYEYERTFIV